MGGRAELSRLSLFRYSLTYTKKGRAKAVNGGHEAAGGGAGRRGGVRHTAGVVFVMCDVCDGC